MTTKQTHKPTLRDICTYEQRHDSYRSYLQRIQQTRFTTGFKVIDDEIRGVGPGEMMIIGAYSGTFKSAYLQNVLMSYSKRSGLYSLMFSLEMPNEKIFEREMQIANGVSGREVEYRMNNLSQRTVEMSRACQSSGSDKLLTVERPKLTLPLVAEYIGLAKERYDIGVVGIDYLGLLKGSARSTADLTEDMSNGAKELAKEAGVPVILLTQINRTAAIAQTMEGQEIELHHLKYGGEAGADIVLGMYRDAEDCLVLKVLKNRGGPPGSRFLADLEKSAMQFKDFIPYIPPKKKGKRSQEAEDLPFQ